MKRILAVMAGLAAGVSAVAAVQPREKARPAEAGVPADAKPPPSAPQPETPDLTKQPTLYVVGYAHLDTQWRWTYADSIREYIPATLNDNFKLFGKYPHYVFNFGGSRRYRFMQEYYPADFEKLRGYVKSGQWFPCGSSVDENDANVPSAESQIRHVLYGNKYFRREFGVASEEFMLPDCFGFPAALPSVLAHCGLKGFSTQKLTWNAVVPIPFKVGVWEGPDGRSVCAALDPGSYVGEVRENLATEEGWKNRINANGQKSGVYADYHYFGTGDTGGAPGEKSVAMVEESLKTAGPIKVVSGPSDALFKALTPELAKNLPRYKGELMLTEHSAGSITSQAYMKRWNRKNELLADAAERASLGALWLTGKAYPAQKLEDAWYLVLGSQMHDILPGTSLPKAYDYSWNDEVLAANQFGTVLEDAAGAIIGTMNTTGRGTSIVVYNPLSTEREDVVEADVEVPRDKGVVKGVKVTGPDGKAVKAQVLDGKGALARIAFLAKVPSVGFAAFDVDLMMDMGPSPPESTLRVTERELENERYRVKLDDNGDVSSIFDKPANREVLSAPARLGLHYENPRQWPAWNQDWADRQLPAKAYVGGPARFQIVEVGPARGAIEVTREAEGSIFVQRIRLAAGGAADRVEFDTRVDWRSRERSLRAAFPLSVSNPKATYDVQTGTLERGNGHEKQFEYCFHQWFDLTDAASGYGASIMCDSKYGADKPTDNTVRLTLLHTPGTRGGYPDQGTQDIGRHNFVYAISGHVGDWRKGEAPAQAERLNQPLIAFRSTPHEGAAKSLSLARVSDPAVSISAAKRSEAGDEVIIRVRERTGSDAKKVRIGLANAIQSAREVDGQERAIGDGQILNGELVTDVHGYGLRAFAVKLVGPGKGAEAESVAIQLPFDADVISTNAKRTDGAMDEQGRSFPAEQLPAAIDAEGVKFTLGSGAEGQKNALTCRGQEIAIPQGGYDRLYLLAAANGDTTTNVQVDGKAVPLKVQDWTGYIGQWDRRVWPEELSEADRGDAAPARRGRARSNEPVGLDPGFVKPAPVAWYATHYHTPKGDTFYEYSYLFKYAIDLPAGAKNVKLPNEPRVKVFAASAARVGAARVAAARPLFDTLEDHAQDRPMIIPREPAPKVGGFTDATEVRIEPTLYWRNGSIRYTSDGSEPTAQSAAYTGPIPLAATTTIKAAVLDRAGKLGPVASGRIEVNDRTPPTVTGVEAMLKSPVVRVEFSEPVGPGATEPSRYAIEPSIAVNKVELTPDKRTALLVLGGALEPKQGYQLKVTGVKDLAPTGNTIAAASVEFAVKAPVFEMAEVPKDQMGKQIRDVPGLPVKAGDAWTINMFVKIDKQPENRTLIAGFGKAAQAGDGGARYLAKFANGLQFWSHNRDVGSRARMDTGRWQMLTATYDGRVLRLYKDGQKIAESPTELADDENVVNIAPIDPWERQRQFQGELKSISIWNGALGEEAIRALKGPDDPK